MASYYNEIVNVYSEKGKGAIFNIYIPASEKEVILDKGLSGEVIKGTETVLLVDDEDMIIDLGKAMLEALRYNLFLAGSSRETMEIYKKNRERINVVLLDMIMPEMGGSEIYDQLKAIKSDIKVLLSSCYSINGLAKITLAKGCDGFIQKPFSLRDLSQN